MAKPASWASGASSGLGVIAASLLALSFAATDAQEMAEERAIQAIVQGVTPGQLNDEEIAASYQEMETNLEMARNQIGQLSRQVMELKIQLDDERTKVASSLESTEGGESVSQRIVALNDEMQQLREE